MFSMTTEEIARVLKENIGKVVHVALSDGESLCVLVLNLDGEGFVYELVPKDEKTEYWTRFDWVVEVKPLG
jgi:hypothetical protein